MSQFLKLRLLMPSITYLERLAQAAPIDFVYAPEVYLTSPEAPLTLSDEDYKLFAEGEVHVPLELDTGMALYNPKSQRSEFSVIMRADPQLVEQLPEAHRNFKPYFVWAYDPNRSAASRNFLVSLINSMVSDAIALIGVISVADSTDPLHGAFNPLTQTDLHNVYLENNGL